jgi:Calx-beta domain
MWRRGIVLSVFIGLIGLGCLGADDPALAGNGAKASTALIISVGNASLVPSVDAVTRVTVPITLSKIHAAVVTVRYTTVAQSAVAGQNFDPQSGSVTFTTAASSAASVQRDVSIVLPAQALSTTVSFEVTIFGYPRWVASNNASGNVTLFSNSAGPPGDELQPTANVGDASIYNGVSGPARRLVVSVTLSTAAPQAVAVTYKTVNDVALQPEDYARTTGTVTFAPGQTQKYVNVPIKTVSSPVPNRIFYVTIASTSSAVQIGRSMATMILINGRNSGIITNADDGYRSATLTSDRNHRTDRFDTFALDLKGATTTMTGHEGNFDTNSRLVFWRSDEGPSLNQETCATWLSQSPANGSGAIVQEGVALRASTLAGVTRAITITKNVFGSNRYSSGANAVFDVILWDSTLPDGRFYVIGEAKLYDALFPDGAYVALPWDICAEVIGTTISFVVWPRSMQQPAWGDSTYGGTYTIPEADAANWSSPGYAGWYFGHLGTESSMAYSDLSTRALSP